MSELDDLKRRIEALEKRADERAKIESDLLEAARQYARLTTLSYAMDERGIRVQYPPQDAQDFANGVFLVKMKLAAVQLLRVETS